MHQRPRFPRNELIRRVEAIAAHAGSIRVSNLDAEEFMAGSLKHLRPDCTLVYCDPPYFERAKGLYPAWYEPDDHERLAASIQNGLTLPWLVSYNSHPILADLYSERRQLKYSLQYSAVRAYKGTELFIFSDDLALRSSSVFEPVSVGLKAAEF